MSNKRKARPGAATLERAMEQGHPSKKSRASKHHCTPSAPPGQGIAQFLGRGSENSIPLRDLEALTGMDGRTLRQLIQHERLQGTTILSSSAAGSGGYYLAASPAEVACFASAMRRRAGEIERVAAAVESVLIT